MTSQPLPGGASLRPEAIGSRGSRPRAGVARLSSAQGIAVVDAAARWLAEDNGEELARALLHVAARDPITANFVCLALIDPAANGQ